MQRMEDIQLHMWATPNSRRVSILFEELELDFEVRPVNIRAGQQFEPQVLELNPFGKVPVVTWRDGDTRRVLFESGAILVRFAECRNQFLPADGSARDKTLAWLMVVLTALGPHSSQAHHWSRLAAAPSELALQHHKQLVKRVYRLLDDRLSNAPYLAGEHYSIADIAAYPWIDVWEWTTLNIRDFPSIEDWYQKLRQRPAVARGMGLPLGAVLE